MSGMFSSFVSEIDSKKMDGEQHSYCFCLSNSQ
jgi:hypothetical protein